MKRLLSLFAISFFLMTSCSSSKLVATWKAQEEVAKPKKILVMVVSHNLASRQAVEDMYSEKIRQMGIPSDGSLFIFPPDLDLNEETLPSLRQIAVKNHYDAALIVSLMDVKEEERYVEGSTYYQPSYYGGFGPYYYNSYYRVNSPGYYESSTTYFVENRLYFIGDPNLKWAGQTSSVDPGSIEKFSMETRELVINKLFEDLGWLPPKE